MKRLHPRMFTPSWSALRLPFVAGSLFSILALGPFAAPVCAQTTLNGGSYTYSTPQDPNGIIGQNGASIALLDGGTIGSGSADVGLQINDTSTLNMQGGSLVGVTSGFYDLSTATSTISGGSITGGSDSVKDSAGGILNITGGSFSGALVADGSVINLYGDLSFVGSNVVGTLEDGESINNDTLLRHRGTINLINTPVVPEGDSLLLMGSGLLPLALFARRRRRA